jgi:hemolysin activation/secretion protein
MTEHLKSCGRAGRWLALALVLFAASSLRAQVPAAPQGGADTLFVAEYVLEGNTLLPVATVELALEPFLGPDRSPGDILAARDALAKALEAAGYLGASVEEERRGLADPTDPTQGWVVAFRLMPGPVERLRISGAQYNLPSRIREAVPSAAEGQVLNFPRFQEDLARVAGLAGTKVTPVLRPGRNPGTMEVELKVADELPLAAWAELTNDDSPDTSPRRLELGLRYDNLLQRQHSLTARYITTPLQTKEVKVLSLSYGWPGEALAGGSERWSLFAVVSQSEVQANTNTGVIGSGNTLGLRWTRIFPALGDFSHNLTLGMDYKDLKEDSQATGSRPLRYLPLSLQYGANLADSSGRWQFGASVNAGLRWLNDKRLTCQGVEDVDAFACRRAGASPDFIRLGATVRREQDLAGLGLAGWNLDLRGELQLAGEPLIGNEQFYAGGADSVRGYYASEQGGDDGLRVSVEFQGPRWAALDGRAGLQALAFLDGAYLRRQGALPGESAQAGLAGAGLGLRLNWRRNFSASVDWARTLRAGPRTPDKAHRLHANLRVEY